MEKPRLTSTGSCRARRPGLTVAILPPPGGQQRSANAMPPRCGGRPAVADKALLHNAQFIIIRPIPPAIPIGSGPNVDLRAVDKAGHTVGLTIGSNPRSHRHRQRLTWQARTLGIRRPTDGPRVQLSGQLIRRNELNPAFVDNVLEKAAEEKRSVDPPYAARDPKRLGVAFCDTQSCQTCPYASILRGGTSEDPRRKASVRTAYSR